MAEERGEEERGSVMPFHLLVCERAALTADVLLAEGDDKKVESRIF